DPVECGAGELPLPHYIRRDPGAADDSSYQTLYAKKAGSAAAPTAGLHFTPQVMERLKAQGAAWGGGTLQVGLGTLPPVKQTDIRNHTMHDESYEIPSITAQRLNEAKQQGRKITAVGTTSVRTLESAWRQGQGSLNEGVGRTSIFIYPGEFKFAVVDR